MKATMAEGTTAAPMQSSVHWALLGLVIERPSYGYELAHRFERTYGEMLRLSGASYIYTALKALERRALIEEIPGRGGRRQPKPCYRATTTGVDAYQQRLIAQLHEERRRSRLFARQLAVLVHRPQAALEVIESYARACLQEAAATPLVAEDVPRDCVAALAARLEAEEERLAMEAKLPWIDYARSEFKALAASQRARR